MTTLRELLPDEPRRILTDLLRDLGIGTSSLDLQRSGPDWRVSFDCTRHGERCRIALDLAADTFSTVRRDPAMRDALLVELDEHLADCERCRGEAPPPPRRDSASGGAVAGCGQ
jgi:hypothetical protein